MLLENTFIFVDYCYTNLNSYNVCISQIWYSFEEKPLCYYVNKTLSILTHLIKFFDWKKTLKENTKSLNMSGKETNANTGHM